jgi:DNA-binding MarR family transcriptional regulator
MPTILKKDYEALAAFRYAMRQFLRTSENNARAAGITPQQYQLLLAIKGMKGRDWATISEIAESLQVLHHSAVGLCARAEQSNLVIKSVHKDDRRQVCIQLTSRGEKLLAAVAKENRRELSRIQQHLLQPFAKELGGK